MTRIWLIGCTFVAVATAHATEGGVAPAAKLEPARTLWKGTKASTAEGETLCIGICDPRKFTVAAHKTVQADLWESTARGVACTDALNRGLYEQDLAEFYKAEAHFDNCAFDESLEYLHKLKVSAEGLMLSARNAFRRDRDRVSLQEAVLKAVHEFGRALHIVQDFYAHTNYIDLIAVPSTATDSPALASLRERSVVFSDSLALSLWIANDAVVVRSLQASAGLVSGTVMYEAPRLDRCQPGSPTHGQLAKDAPDKGNGAAATRWEGLSKHQAATALARKSTRDFIQGIATTWPELEGVCGNYIRALQVSDERVIRGS